MLTIAISIIAFIIALALLSVGVMLKKRTPLKGSCGSAATRGETGSKEHVCEACSCDRVPGR
jgi:hypothetical protein